MPATTVKFQGYTITRNPKPGPSNSFDWDWVHDDYQGPGDDRCGWSASLADAERAIEQINDGDEDEDDEDAYDEDEYDGQPDEAQEWHDFDPDC
jgi:hypothetical protein